jgi:hypothetical protein
MDLEADETSGKTSVTARGWLTFANLKGDEEAANETGREGGLCCGFVDQLSDTKNHPRVAKSGENIVTTR